MARVILILLCAALGLAATPAEAAPCAGQKTVLFFVNGVWVSPTDAQKSVNALKERLGDDLGCDLPVLAAYNQSVSRADDLWAASQKLGNPIDPELARLIANGSIQLAQQSYPAFAAEAAEFFAGEIVRNIVAFTGQSITPDDEDVQTHYAQYVVAVALNAGYRVVLVAVQCMVLDRFVANLSVDGASAITAGFSRSIGAGCDRNSERLATCRVLL